MVAWKWASSSTPRRSVFSKSASCLRNPSSSSLRAAIPMFAAIGVLSALLCARRRLWVAAVLCALFAMFSKEHGVVAGILVLLDDWLRPAVSAAPNRPAEFAAFIHAQAETRARVIKAVGMKLD